MSASPHPVEWRLPFSERRSWWLAVASGFVIAILGGLIGLGGAEFRLPVLIGVFALAARRAVPLNLLVSLVTVATALAGRTMQGALVPVWDFRVALAALAMGGIVGARLGVRLVGRMSDERLEQAIAGLLLAIAVLLGIEAALGEAVIGPLARSGGVAAASGLMAGVAIGIVSSLLGVAGGELLIPTLVFVFGADIKTAGTGSLLVSLPTVLVGVAHYRRLQAWPSPAVVRDVGLPMAFGSVVGALVGARLVGWVDAATLKAILGAILGLSAIRMWRRHEHAS